MRMHFLIQQVLPVSCKSENLLWSSRYLPYFDKMASWSKWFYFLFIIIISAKSNFICIPFFNIFFSRVFSLVYNIFLSFLLSFSQPHSSLFTFSSVILTNSDTSFHSFIFLLLYGFHSSRRDLSLNFCVAFLFVTMATHFKFH